MKPAIALALTPQVMRLTFVAARFRQGSSVVEHPESIRGWSDWSSLISFELTQRQGSSVVEQGTHKPLVGSSNLPPGSFVYLGFIFFEDPTADIISAPLLILIPALLNTRAAIRIQLSGLATLSKSSQARRSQH